MPSLQQKSPVETVGKRTNPPASDTIDLQESERSVAKRVALGHETALAGLTLQVVMQYAGKNEGIFVANVCRNWKESYNHTFNDWITTNGVVAVMSLQRLHWIWSDLPKLEPGKYTYIERYGVERDASWYVGKYAPRSVVEGAISDESLEVSSEYVMQGVAGSGRLALIDDLWSNHAPTNQREIAKLGAEGAAYGHIEIFALMWSRLEKDDKANCAMWSAYAACIGGYLHILELLILSNWWNMFAGHYDLCKYAAKYKRIEILRWFRAHDQEFDECVAYAAAASGDIPTIEYLSQNGCPFEYKGLVSCCVQHGRLDALQWFHRTPAVTAIWTDANLQEWLLLAGTYNRKKYCEVPT